MPSLRLFFLVALLMAVVLAVPAPTRKRGVQKRSFKVPRSLNKNHPRGLNGFDAMKKVAMKYNLPILKEGFISNDKQTAKFTAPKVEAAKDANGTGTVAA